jgi:predicted Zn-dependent protease
LAIHRIAEGTARFAGILLLALGAASCAKNPVTGQRQLMLITDEQEFAIGEGADKEIRTEYGSYLESPALRAYVDGVGNALAARSERPGIVYHFVILNTPVVNAFALPGGFVYITRGMLERLSTEDQLAMVVGHEIGHVAARHGAARISAIYALQYGTLVGAIISPRTFVNYNDLIDLALQVGLSKYSRDQERQADQLGVAYAASSGYRPEEAVKVMEILKWMEGKEPAALEKWFLSHPPAGERIDDITGQVHRIEAEKPAVRGREAKRAGYLRQIDGLIVGLYNGSEMVLKDRYYNKELAVSLRVPSAWDVDLDPNGALVRFARKDKEMILLESDPMHTPTGPEDLERAFDETLRRRSYTRTGGRQARTSQDVPVRLATYRGSTAKGEPIGVLKGFLTQGKREWTFTALCELEMFEARRGDYEAAALDLRFLPEAEAEALRPPRLKVLPAPAGATWGSLAADHLGVQEGGERLAFYNGMDPDVSPAPGTLVKIPPSLAVKP